MKIAFLFYDGMTAFDAIGPHEILSCLPDAKILRVAKKSGLISTDSELKLTAEYNLSEVTSADVLCVPGAGNATTLQKFPEILSWVRDIDATTHWTTSVCAGALILGAAGILSGLRATTHALKGTKPSDKERELLGCCHRELIPDNAKSAGLRLALFEKCGMRRVAKIGLR